MSTVHMDEWNFNVCKFGMTAAETNLGSHLASLAREPDDEKRPDKRSMVWMPFNQLSVVTGLAFDTLGKAAKRLHARGIIVYRAGRNKKASECRMLRIPTPQSGSWRDPAQPWNEKKRKRRESDARPDRVSGAAVPIGVANALANPLANPSERLQRAFDAPSKKLLSDTDLGAIDGASNEGHVTSRYSRDTELPGPTSSYERPAPRPMSDVEVAPGRPIADVHVAHKATQSSEGIATTEDTLGDTRVGEEEIASPPVYTQRSQPKAQVTERKAAPASTLPQGLFEQVVSEYHKVLPYSPKVQMPTPRLRNLLAERVKEHKAMGYAADTMEHWTGILALASRQTFVRYGGRYGGAPFSLGQILARDCLGKIINQEYA